MSASPISRYGSGKSVKRVEDEALLRGHGRFADNVKVDGELCACFVRSPHPHARILRIDAGAAASMPGVVRVVTGDELVRAGVKPMPCSADFKRAGGKPTATPPRHALAVGTVRFVGEAVAAVIAATPASEPFSYSPAAKSFCISAQIARHSASPTFAAMPRSATISIA